MTLDPSRPLVMASAKTVLGHALPVGHPLRIVDEPTEPGDVDEAMARRLYASKLAGYRDELHATPVETPEQERNRLAMERLRDARATAPGGEVEITPTDDLVVHPEGTPKAGKKVTKNDLIEIADREGVEIETDDNKPDLVRKIMEHRASLVPVNGTNAETEGAGGQGDTLNSGSVAPFGTEGAENGPEGDAHGEAGEGPSDSE